MKKFFTSAIFICALIFSVTANAASWLFIGNDELGNEYFLDTSSVEIESKTDDKLTFYAVFKANFVEDMKARWNMPNLSYAFHVYRFEKVGDTRRCAVLYTQYFSADDKIIDSAVKPSDWKDVRTGSINETFYDAAAECLNL